MNDSCITLFSLSTELGKWSISTHKETLDISQLAYGFAYYLSNDKFPDFRLSTNREIYDLVNVVARHRTGLKVWDETNIPASDFIKDWTPEFDNRLLINLVADFLRFRPHDPMRGMIDYFEHKHSYFLDRMTISDLLRELIMNGDIDLLPSMLMAQPK